MTVRKVGTLPTLERLFTYRLTRSHFPGLNLPQKHFLGILLSLPTGVFLPSDLPCHLPYHIHYFWVNSWLYGQAMRTLVISLQLGPQDSFWLLGLLFLSHAIIPFVSHSFTVLRCLTRSPYYRSLDSLRLAASIWFLGPPLPTHFHSLSVTHGLSILYQFPVYIMVLMTYSLSFTFTL